MQVLFEVVEDGFDLGAHVEELDLPRSSNLFPLLWMRWCDHDRAISSPHPLAHHRGTIQGIANRDTSVFVQEQMLHVRVVHIRSSECECAQFSAQRDRCVQLEPEVPALPVLAESSALFHHFVGIGSVWFAHGEHRGIHDAYRFGVGQDDGEYIKYRRERPVRFTHKGLVCRHSWKITRVIQAQMSIYL